MLRTPCPACGAEMVFQSAISTYAVCLFCRSTVVRGDVDVALIGKAAVLPRDMSPFQIGTTGGIDLKGRGKLEHFILIGCLRVGWQDGYWNEWFLHMGDGRKGWLAEAQGTYAVSFELDTLPAALDPIVQKAQAAKLPPLARGPWAGAATAELQMPSAEDVASVMQSGWSTAHATPPAGSVLPGHYPAKGPAQHPALFAMAIVENVALRVVDIKRARRIGSEGELPFQFEEGSESTVLDFLGPNGEFASLEIGPVRHRFFQGRYAAWEELNIREARRFDGWSAA